MLNRETDTRSRARSRNDNNVGAEIGQNNINANAVAVAVSVGVDVAGGDIVAETHFNQLQANLALSPLSHPCGGVAGEDRVVCMANALGLWPAAAVANLPRSVARRRQLLQAGGRREAGEASSRRGQFGHLTRSLQYLLPRLDA